MRLPIELVKNVLLVIFEAASVADPGFPGGNNSEDVCEKLLIGHFPPKKLYENKIDWTERRERVPAPTPLTPGSANAFLLLEHIY